MAIAAPVSKLQIRYVRRVPALGYRDNVVYAGGQRVRIFERKINRSAAYSAHGLRGVYPFLVRAELLLMSAAAVGSFDRQGVHSFGVKISERVQKDTPPESGVPLRKFIGGSEANGAAHKVMPSVAARDLRPVNHMKGDSSKKSKSVLSYCPQFKL